MRPREHGQRIDDIERAARLERRLEVEPCDVLHAVVERARLEPAGIEHLHDAGMAELAECENLAAKAACRLRPGVAIGAHQLERPQRAGLDMRVR